MLNEDKNNEEQKDNINDLKKKIEELEMQKQEFLSGWQRTMADLINYKKEEAERLESFANSIKTSFILKILPILDNLDIVEKKFLQFKKEEDKLQELEILRNYQTTIEGLFQIKRQLINLLSKEGLEMVETVGKDFDPLFHEAVEIVEDKNKKSGEIIEELQAGYKFKENLIRPAKVKIVK
ncbi:MAG: nucleotide exchange factor GrpE [Minisyncoccia bacterium]